MKRTIAIVALLASLASEAYSHQIFVGVRTDILRVIDYWENKGELQHNLLIYNPGVDTISVSVSCEKIDYQTLDFVNSARYIDRTKLAPRDSIVFAYPRAEYKGRYLHFIVNGYASGILKIDMREPAVDIPKNRFVTRCQRDGTHAIKMWFVFRELIVPHRKSIKFSVLLECRKKQNDPKHLLVSLDNTKIQKGKGLIVRKYEDKKYNHEHDLNDYNIIIEYPVGEFGRICYGTFKVTLYDIPQMKDPFSPQFIYRVVESTEVGGGIPLIIE